MTFIVRQIAVTADGREIIRANPFSEAEITIGRNAESAIHLPDLAVNPEHAVIRELDDSTIQIESISGQKFSVDGRDKLSTSLDPADGAELGFGGHVISVSKDDDGIILTVKRVEALSDSAEDRVLTRFSHRLLKVWVHSSRTRSGAGFQRRPIDARHAR